MKKDVQEIVNRTEKIKDLEKKKSEATDENTEKALKKEIDKEEKERQSKRKQIQQKLMQFVTRIPIFMYLSEEYEENLNQVIYGEEPTLFHKVAGISQGDFGKLNDVNLFNKDKMDLAILGFKRIEAKSLEYSKESLSEKY